MSDPKPPSDRDAQQEQEEWYERTRYQIHLFAGGIALFGLVLGWILDWYIDPQTSTQKKDLVQALGLITAGVAGAVGIFFTWRGQRITREAQEENRQSTQAQLRHAQEELSLSRQGQITERFTRAIDQLGHDRAEIRLGGSYALERIARESVEDHWPIMEVLTAYVRQHAPSRPEEAQQGEEDQVVEKSEEAPEVTKQKSEPTEVPAPAPDIQAIMTVIRRRTRYYGHGEPEPLNLHETNLSRVNLSGAHLWEATLFGANLTEAYLTGADLKKASFLGAVLVGANLLQADLSDANLWDANLTGANLRGANLTKATLTQAQLEETTGAENTQLPSDLKPPRTGV